MLKIFNTLSRKIEEFKPLVDGKVGMYTCGPTVHDFQHIGNFRSMVFSDLLRRVLELNSFEVKTVRNITDIDDKIIKKAAEKNLSLEEFTQEFTQIFFDDLSKLNVLPVDVSCKATEHITQMVKYIEVLLEKGFAYQEDDGSVYFDISKFPDYGKLSQLDKRELKTGTRILSDEYDKENVQDFALWKSVKLDEVGYDSPWGRGRPGWHIECSVMSQEYLGDTFDIHTGGIDLLFPHHENEIAQSEAKTGQQFVRYFVHGEHLLVDGQKMSKSLRNYYTLKDLEEKGFDPLTLRYLFLTAHYRDKLNFTWESLGAAQNALNNLRDTIRDWSSVIPSEVEGSLANASSSETSSEILRFTQNDMYVKFLEALNNDLNTPQALAVMWELVREKGQGEREKSAILLEMDKVLGLGLQEYIGVKIEIPEEVKELVEKRERVREQKDFTKSDEIRKEINDLGFSVEDLSSGPKIKKI